MENYVGTKIIKAKKVKFKEYLEKKYGSDFVYKGNLNLNDLVYMVVYPPIGAEGEPYISMSPVEVFEKCYRKIENSEISLIID